MMRLARCFLAFSLLTLGACGGGEPLEGEDGSLVEDSVDAAIPVEDGDWVAAASNPKGIVMDCEVALYHICTQDVECRGEVIGEDLQIYECGMSHPMDKFYLFWVDEWGEVNAREFADGSCTYQVDNTMYDCAYFFTPGTPY